MTARKCIKCKQAIPESEDFHLIFDEKEKELELQKLLLECFNIKVVKKRRDNQGLCSDCVEILIDTFDVIQKHKEAKLAKAKNASEENNSFTFKEPKREIPEETFIKSEDHEEIPESTDAKKSPQKESPEKKKLEVERDDPLEIEQVYVSSKNNLGEFFEDDVENYEEEEDSSEEGETNLVGSWSVEDEAKMKGEREVLKTDVEESIDIYEYKKSVIKVDPIETNFEKQLYCVYCKENIIFHKNILEHTTKFHTNEAGLFKCIANKDCEEFSNMKDLSFHLILKHYDLMFLKIDLNCPECKSAFGSFAEYNEHYCYIKGVISRSKRVCKICDIEFLSHKRYKVHQMFHLPTYRPKICFICDIKFKMEEDFYNHIMYDHKSKEELALTCKQCDLVSTSEKLFKKHKKTHLKDFVAKCPICSNSYGNEYRLKLHIRHTHEAKSHYDCKICNKPYHFKGQLKMHLEDHTDVKEGTIFVCSVCGLCEGDIKEFRDHYHEETQDYIEEVTNLVYACEYCEKAYIRPDNLRVHKEATKHKTYDCDMCKEKFDRFPSLKTHRLNHNYGNHKLSKFPTGRNYLCTSVTCDATFLRFHLLRKHNYTHNWFEKVRKCKLCGKNLSNYEEMIAHLEEEHTEVHLDGIAKLKCTTCQKMFKTKSGLRSHISAKHTSNEFQCSECSYSYKTEKMLKNHYKYMHANVVCHICGKSLRNKHLPYHLNAVHKKIIRFRCHLCEKGYYLNSDLQDHIKLMHSSDKPQKCTQCSFSCHYPNRLKLHILTKHEGKPAPFQCKVCSDGFYTENTLRSHMLKHGPKEFKCLLPDCDSEFYSRSHLLNHGRKAHKMEFENDAPKRKRRTREEIRKAKNIKIDDEDFEVEEVENCEEMNAMEVEYLEEEFLDLEDPEPESFEIEEETPQFVVEFEPVKTLDENV